jgi:hypothetical protein
MNIPEVLLGGLVGLALALLAQPLLEDPARSFLIRLLGRLPLIRGHTDVSGDWHFVWWKDGEAPSRSFEKKIHLITVGSKVAGKFNWKDSTYQLIGTRHTDEFISGIYVDEKKGNIFHGAFQLKVFKQDRLMAGRWMGYDSNDDILSGPWYLRRANQEHYSYEGIAPTP